MHMFAAAPSTLVAIGSLALMIAKQAARIVINIDHDDHVALTVEYERRHVEDRALALPPHRLGENVRRDLSAASAPVSPRLSENMLTARSARARLVSS